MGKEVVYPGSFDPVTLGHSDLIKRARTIFDRVVVAVADNSEKKPIFSREERLQILREITRDIPGVEIDYFSGLLVDYLKKKGIKTILRGLRAVSDFDYEFQMVLTNRRLAPEIETVFLMPQEDYFFLSSSLIKEIAHLGADLSAFVPKAVEKALKEKLEVKNAKSFP
ncbi:MAG: pantetheine-phosphate adenylyltransferase [Candidatus Omnitrophota bacterium]